MRGHRPLYLYFVLWAYPILAVAITLNIVRTIAEHEPEDYPRFENGEVAMRPVARTTVRTGSRNG